MNKKGISKNIGILFLLSGILVLIWIVLISAGNVIVRDGELNITGDFYVNQSMFFVNTTSGFVGIGTGSPGAKLDILSDSSTAYPASWSGGTSHYGPEDYDALFLHNNDATGNFTSILMRSGNTAFGAGRISLVKTDATAGAFTFSLRSGGAMTERMRITDTGKVGIGTTSPNTTLHVQGDINVTSAYDICIDGGDCLSDAGVGSSGWTDDGGIVRLTTSTDDVNLTAMYVNQTSGRVGIGTVAPQNTLNIVGDANVTGLCVAENSMISMADGTKKKITEIKEGDYVLSLEIVENDENNLLARSLSQINTGLLNEDFSEDTNSQQDDLLDGEMINNNLQNDLLVNSLINPKQTGEQNDLSRVSELEEEESIDASNYREDNNLINSSVVKTGIKDCSLKCLSLDQIGRFNVDASAKYATSFESEILEENFLISFEYSNLSTNTIFSLRDLIAELKLSSDLSDNSFLCLCSSINEKSGANNFNENLEKRELATLECLDNANKTLASTTNFILDYNNFSFLSCSATPLFTLRPISIHQSVNPASSSCLSLFNISSFQANCLALDSMQVLTNPDQLISGKLFICALTSSGIDKVIDTILSVKKHKYVEVFKSFDLNNDIFFDKIVSIKQEICRRN